MVRFELGQCYYLSGEREQALKTFRTVREHLLDEAAMSLLLEVYRYRLDAAELPVVEAGDRCLRHWRDEAEKYAATPYGRQLSEDLAVLGEGQTVVAGSEANVRSV